MSKSLRLLAALAVTGCLLLVLAGCDTFRNLPGIRSEQNPEYKIADCEPGIPSKLLRISVLHPPLTFNPVLAQDRVSALVAKQFTAALYRYNPIADTFEPGLATGLDRDKDAKVFTIHLRRNVFFSDGSPFTADDVMTTLNYIGNTDITSPRRAYLEVADQKLQFQKLDAESIRCSSPEPLHALEPILAKIVVLPRALIEGAASRNRMERLYNADTPPAELVSIGPFVLKSFSREEKKLVLARNPYYWVVDAVGRPLPYLDEVVLDFTGTSADISVKFRTGESDLIDFIDPADAARLENVRGLRIFDTGPSSATYVAWINQNMKTDPASRENYIPAFRLQWFFDAKFRHALSLLFDRENIITNVFQRKAVTTGGLIAPGDGPWWSGLQADSFSTANARQLLTESGFVMNTSVTPNALYGANKSPVQFTITVLTGDAFAERIGIQTERVCASLGMKATMVSLPYDLFYQKIHSTYDYDMAVMLLEQPAHPFFLKELMSWSSPGHLWYPEQGAPATPLEKDMATALATMYGSPDWGKRFEAAHQLEQYNAQGRYLIPIAKPHGLFGAKGKVQNLRVNHRCMSLMWNLEEVYVQE